MNFCKSTFSTFLKTGSIEKLPVLCFLNMMFFREIKIRGENETISRKYVKKNPGSFSIELYILWNTFSRRTTAFKSRKFYKLNYFFDVWRHSRQHDCYTASTWSKNFISEVFQRLLTPFWNFGSQIFPKNSIF